MKKDKDAKKTPKQVADNAEVDRVVLKAVAAMPEPYRAMGSRLQDEKL